MIAFTPERLAVHETLLRVTSDLSVPDGIGYEVLGLNLRGMTAKLIETYIKPQMPSIIDGFNEVKSEARSCLLELVAELSTPVSIPDPRKGLARLFGKAPDPRVPDPVSVIDSWISDDDDALEDACKIELRLVAAAVLASQERLTGLSDILVEFALRRVMNRYGSRMIGQMIGPIVKRGAKAEGYAFLPAQAEPVFMNVKGASAAGKSTIRPQQRRLAKKLKIPWEEFALISPDYWRKYLLDYESLGDDYKYAAMLTGQELEVIDRKLDDYMAAKAKVGNMPHLLIDRFRFDSFDNPTDNKDQSRLLTRFGHTVYLFFIITPPSETVERAWGRGKTTGRYKAVDDLLFHNIEAYIGMPNLFFSWALSTDKNIHFEFLDNSVPLGARPRTIAFGWNNKMTVLDVEKMGDIDRFKHVNLEATCAEQTLVTVAETPFEFLRTCVERIPEVTFADHKTLKVYGASKDGELTFDSSAHSFQSHLKWTAATEKLPSVDRVAEEPFTLGAWG